ncbi:hypothetical protein PQ465_08025 [Sphingobacterium oryzagri]|uniref:Uncharacterized protein n=1 Tax=Sphingobacterium oryzagri TaxID=3025669 RepID=A0ABY7WPR8_9SPHI|nr:hypothetical protein [Sphingobacterium sp. KACC 22765]WDF70315.1 hypothetical protein PQ465_08025 [Sphingobacterium sp. KACC 22765]
MKIAYVGLGASLFSLLLVFFYVFFTTEANSNSTNDLNPGAIAYGLTIFCNLGLSICALTSLLSTTAFFQIGWKRWCCWFLLPVAFAVYVLYSSTDGRPTVENAFIFLLMILPWFSLWFSAYRKVSYGLPKLVFIAFTFCLLSCTSTGTRNDALVQVDTTVSEEDTAKLPIALLDSSLNKPSDTESVGKQLVTCEEPFGSMEEGFTTVCFWSGYRLSEAYTAFRKKNSDNDDGKFLQDSLPTVARDTSFGDYPFAVSYTPNGADILHVELNFPGGSTSITFLQKAKGVEIRTLHAPD